MLPLKNFWRNLSKAKDEPGYALRVLRKRIVSTAYYYLGRGMSPLPETISIFMTYRCNLRCKMCGQWGREGAFKGLQDADRGVLLDPEVLYKLFDEVRSFRPNITLFGGEPSMYPGWIDIVKGVKDRGMRCNIVTNGTLVGEYADEIVASGLDEIILSLDGIGDRHDRIRGVKGTYEKLLSGFAMLKKARQKGSRPIVRINCTVSEDNYESLHELLNAAEVMGAESVTFHHLLFLGKEVVQQHERFYTERFQLDSRDWWGFAREELPRIDTDVLLEQMNKIRSHTSGAKASFYPNFTPEEIRRYYTEFSFRPDSYSTKCMSPWMTAYVFPDGSVKPYHSMSFSAGNIKEHGFIEIWNNQKYKRYRKTVKDIGCFAVCTKGCTELYRY